MKKFGIPAVRLILAGRVLQRLSIADDGEALARVSTYVRTNADRFGLRLNDTIRDYTVEDFADHVIARSGALGQVGFDDQLKVSLSVYLAGLLGNEEGRINALLYLALASIDDVVRDLVTVASLGAPADRRVYAVPYAGLALLMEGEHHRDVTLASVDLLRGEEYVSTNLVQAVSLTVGRHHRLGTPVVSEHPACRTGNDETGYETIPANALKLHDRIVLALRGRPDPEAPTLDPENAEAGPAGDYESLLGLLAAAAEGGHPGIHAAYRTPVPNQQICTIADQVLAHGRPVVLISEDEANSVLVSLVATQIRACHAQIRGRPVPTVVVPDEWELVCAQAYEPEDVAMPAGPVGVAPSQYDTDVMTAQKRLLYIAGPRTIAPVLWAISEDAPITRELVGLFSEIAALPHDDGATRVAQVTEMAAAHKLVIDAGLAQRIAAYAPDPNELAGAFRRAAITGRAEDLESACRSVMAGAGLGRSLPSAKPDDFDIRLVSTKITYIDPETGAITRENTLESVLAQFVAKKHRPIRMLFHGDPGTSKTSLAKYIASRMGMELAEIKPSHILGKWVGESEKNIAEAFAKARARRQFLLFDEVDSFLTSRAEAKNGWERTSVNEMLTQMQAHSLPMGCTTNFIDRIDKAAIRRFPFRIEAEALNLERARLAWVSILKLPAEHCPNDDTLAGLTVSDFALVAEKMNILEITSPAYARAALGEERASREDQNRRSIGFLAR